MTNIYRTKENKYWYKYWYKAGTTADEVKHDGSKCSRLETGWQIEFQHLYQPQLGNESFAIVFC